MALSAGDVVTVYFVGATGGKRRPAVVVSSASYHANRPDVIVGVITTNLIAATSPSDCVLQDWQAAGLRKPSAFRAYLLTYEANDVRRIGSLSSSDWAGVQERLRVAIDFQAEAP